MIVRYPGYQLGIVQRPLLGDEFKVCFFLLPRELTDMLYILVSSEYRSGPFYPGNDFLVSRAAADIASDRLPYLIVGGIGIAVYQGLGSHHHSGDAEPALHRARGAECKYKSFLFMEAQAFHRNDILTCGLLRGQNAGFYRVAVDQYGTRSACSLRAAVLNRIELKVISQIAQKRLVLFCGSFYSVDSECIRH